MNKKQRKQKKEAQRHQRFLNKQGQIINQIRRFMPQRKTTYMYYDKWDKEYVTTLIER